MKHVISFALALLAAPLYGREAHIWKFETRSWNENHMIYLTGFGPFGEITDNPSGRIAPRLGDGLEKSCPRVNVRSESEVLEVRPGIIETTPLHRYDKIISMGVDASLSTDHIRIERFARNYFFDPDHGTGAPIDPELPSFSVVKGPRLPKDILQPLNFFRVQLGTETSAGTYVCNDTFYRLCRSSKAGYFIHIPNIKKEKDAELVRALSQIVCRILVGKT